MATHPAAYNELCKLHRDAASLGSVGALLNWDQETYMPPAGADNRAEQQALLAGIVHERRTSKRLGDLLAQCEQDKHLNADPATAANLREMRRDYDHATKLPGELVEEIAKVTSQSQEVWKVARQKSDFASFQPMLDKVVGLMRRKAECLGTPAGGELYDALLDEYEPGTSARHIEAVFTPLRKDLTQLICAVAEKTGGPMPGGAKPSRAVKKKVKIDTRCLEEKVEPALQHAFGLKVLEAMGFDLKAGRLDITTHPFCSGVAPGDTRLTTRYRDEKFTDALYGTMHEGGHGLYEQGLPKGGDHGLFGQPLASDISLGIHESQSRMWENFVGRSRHFWKWALPIIRKDFGKKFKKYDADDFFAATNTVTPSFIRVEADEGTYNMHVMVRFELERAMFSGNLKTRDIPGEWNRRYKDYLGVDVPDDRRGCLQDVHWSFGLLGYFPTYTLGNLYAAQFWEKISADMPTIHKQIAKGKMLELREWLRTNIHQHGKRYRAGELCEKVTGKPLESAALLRHLHSRAEAVYGI
ncbi:MAG: carboxypeptidase M32 [Phycisphaerales bacterium]